MRKIYVLSAFLLFAVSCSPDENPLTLSEPTTTLSEPTTTLSEPTTTLSEPTTTLSEPTTTTPPSTSTTKVTELESTTTVAEVAMPQELDFVAVTTDGDSIEGSELWLTRNAHGLTGELSDAKNEFDQNIVFWFWAPN
jgi:cytoskeletal protein RodZ